MLADQSLRYPHRKIVEYLLTQYDHQRQQYIEIHFSELVRKARLGKNFAKSYLLHLIKHNYIQSRNDGYRLFFRLIG